MSSLKRLATVAALFSALVGTAATASAQDMQLNMATPWAGGHWLDLGAKKFAENVALLTSNRIKINVFPAGALGSPLKVTETVQKGIAEVGHNWPGYDWSIDRAGVLFGGWSGGMNPEEYMLWIYNQGGDEMWKQWRREKFGVEIVPCGILESELLMHSHKPVRTVEDFKGLKLRTSGAWAEIAATMGASTVILPGGEVFGALERGVVDATEWGGPGINLSQGFHKIAKYIVSPGLHQPSGGHECMFNKRVWDKISAQDKKLIDTAGRLTMLDTWLGYAKNDLAAYQTMRESKTNEMIRVDPSLVEATMKASRAWADKEAQTNPWFKKVYDDQTKYQEVLKMWPQIRFPVGTR